MPGVLDGGILLARLPKGRLGDEGTRLVGSIVVAQAWAAATARAAIPQHQRRDAAWSSTNATTSSTCPTASPRSSPKPAAYACRSPSPIRTSPSSPATCAKASPPTPATRSSSPSARTTPATWPATPCPSWASTTWPTSTPSTPPPAWSTTTPKPPRSPCAPAPSRPTAPAPAGPTAPEPDAAPRSHPGRRGHRGLPRPDRRSRPRSSGDRPTRWPPRHASHRRPLPPTTPRTVRNHPWPCSSTRVRSASCAPPPPAARTPLGPVRRSPRPARAPAHPPRPVADPDAARTPGPDHRPGHHHGVPVTARRPASPARALPVGRHRPLPTPHRRRLRRHALRPRRRRRRACSPPKKPSPSRALGYRRDDVLAIAHRHTLAHTVAVNDVFAHLVHHTTHPPARCGWWRGGQKPAAPATSATSPAPTPTAASPCLPAPDRPRRPGRRGSDAGSDPGRGRSSGSSSSTSAPNP